MKLPLKRLRDILNSMLTKFRRDKSAHNNIVRAHYMLGSLMIKKACLCGCEKHTSIPLSKNRVATIAWIGFWLNVNIN